MYIYFGIKISTLASKRKFENFTYHKIKISTGGAYAPCMGTPLLVIWLQFV